ncbi:aldehyde dehydrogenase family protein [Oceanobacillus jeddahense]|uniref:Aldehyde dehydrogenase family protein n=2 Tax=Oceanobacillus jeddahense TaxID=1462527 RepID=A0ABY5K2T7_9BACI|nr:aldehyde dehydrogenase family protein [Oceanobacillus jeddahense]UUI05606.1 aldehyde dehydrogenase family protein [Oceanobacillus jeddahense]
MVTEKRKKMFIGGKWVEKDEVIHVYDPQDNSVITTVPKASEADMLVAIEAAEDGAKIAGNMPVHERVIIINKAADYIEDHRDIFAETIASEGSKTITEARGEVVRCINTLRLSAEEARRIIGETIPFDQMPGHENRVGYYYHFPIGIVAAITPFNDPLNLVAHKVGPAIASGNAIIVKPASMTPLSGLLLAEAFEAAGLPEKVLSVVTGSGREIGDILVTHPSIRMVSFTGGVETGEKIAKKAGLKKLSMELGSNSPAIVLQDANIDDAVSSCVAGAFGAVGQNCIGVQRIFIETSKFNEFVRKFVKETKKYKTGNKKDETTDMGPLISEKEAIRVEEWVNEALEENAILLTGGKRDGAFYTPTVLMNVATDAKIATEEIFGPVVLLFEVENLTEAIEKANQVNYGLQAGIFTNDINLAFQAIQQLEVGGIMVNDSSDYRIDGMPFGGVKGSGLGREGVKYTIQEMTEPKVVHFKLG